MGKVIIVTAGPTIEKLDAVMEITNMSTGKLGAIVAERLLDEPNVDKVYYLSEKLAYRPNYPANDGRLVRIQVHSTEDLKNSLLCLLKNPNEHIDAVIHSAAVGDYKGRYMIRGEDLADEIAAHVTAEAALDSNPLNESKIRDIVMSVLTSPTCVQNDDDKISSYEPNLMAMLDLTPKVIGSIKKASPDTILISFKLLKDVTEEELLQVARDNGSKNSSDYVVANTLNRIGNGKHWAKILDKTGVIAECQTKDEIAEVLACLARGDISRPK